LKATTQSTNEVINFVIKKEDKTLVYA